MRDPHRLDSFYDEFKKVHKEQFPDWRFGQLISNFFGWLYEQHKTSDIWFPEEKQMIEWFKEFGRNIGEK